MGIFCVHFPFNNSIRIRMGSEKKSVRKIFDEAANGMRCSGTCLFPQTPELEECELGSSLLPFSSHAFFG